MRNAFLLDVNIWLDYFLPDRPRHGQALALIDGCSEAGFELLVSVASLSDLFYSLQACVKRTLRNREGERGAHLSQEEAVFAREYAWACVDNLTENHTVVGADAGDAWVARKQRAVHQDFEDDLLIAVAYRVQPEFIITNDESLLRHSPYAAIDVADAIKLLELPSG